MKRFTPDHDWVAIDGAIATVGVTPHAQEQIGDVVFVELPAAGKRLAKGDVAAVVESVKAAFEIFAPLAGEVVDANAALDGDPALVNRQPEGEGWLFKLRIADPGQVEALLDERAYQALLH
jgi:glycine cleavage system H protein